MSSDSSAGFLTGFEFLALSFAVNLNVGEMRLEIKEIAVAERIARLVANPAVAGSNPAEILLEKTI